MAFKYQVSLVLRPKDILLITLNHVDALKSSTEDSDNVWKQVEHVCEKLVEVGKTLEE